MWYVFRRSSKIITEKDLKDGIVFEATAARLKHKRFSIWMVNPAGSYWARLKEGFGPIAGFKSTPDLLNYLNKYGFAVVGKMEFCPIDDSQEFSIRGAL